MKDAAFCIFEYVGGVLMIILLATLYSGLALLIHGIGRLILPAP